MAKSLSTNIYSPSFKLNPFTSVSQMCERLGLPESKFCLGWRLVDVRIGELNGLPKSRGRLVATNGMQCIILTDDNFFIGHIAWFNQDKEAVEQQQDNKPTKVVASVTKPSKRQELLSKLFAEMLE